MTELTTGQQTELDWLVYNEPLTYAQLVFRGELRNDLANLPVHGLED